MSEELLPCPFCGSENISLKSNINKPCTNDHAWVQCFSCHTDGPETSTKTEAAAAWNTRKPSGGQDAGEVLEQAAQWFSEYASDHWDKAAQADTDEEKYARENKAQRNQDRADFLRAAILALSSEREAIVAWLHKQSDKGADHALAANKGTTRRAAYGGGSLALKRAANAISSGAHFESPRHD